MAVNFFVSVFYFPIRIVRKRVIFHFFHGPMRHALQISFSIHMAIILAGLFELIDFFPREPMQLPTDVAVISEADFKKILQQPKVKPPEPKLEPKSEPKLEPKPEPKSELKKEPEKKAAKKYDFSAALAAVENAKKVETKEELILDNLIIKPDKNITLNDKALKKLEQKTQQNLQELSQHQTEQVLEQTDDLETTLTRQELTILQEQLSVCWSPPIGAKNAETLLVRIHLKLDATGNLIHAKVLHKLTAKKNDPFYRTAVESALRAVYHPHCTPLTLPKEKFDSWQETILTFNPAGMLQ